MTISVTEAVILAGGTGSRLFPLTLATPKSLLPVGRRPCIEYILDEIHVAGIKKIIIIHDLKWPAVKVYFERRMEMVERFNHEFEIDFIPQETASGNGDALYLARKK